MKNWKTQLTLTHERGTLMSDNINIKRGIFQGDSLSSLLFCISLIQLSLELNFLVYGYKIGFIVATQDQSLFTRNFQANILHNGADPRCRFCNTSTKTIDHFISGCTILAPNEYTNRHNRVGQYIHWKICNHYNIETPEKWYEHKPLPAVDTPEVTILWDFLIRTDRTIQANRSDIVIKYKQNKTCQFIDMSVPSDSNISAKKFEKISKYKDLEIETAKMQKMNTKTIPAIVGTLSMIKKGTQKNVNKIPGNLSLAETQIIVLNSTAHILKRTLSL